MSKTGFQANTLTKENQPNNQQILHKINNISKSEIQREQKMSEINSKINMVEAQSGDTVKSCYEASDNLTVTSEFEDAFCGEPIKEQIIHLDFTPIEGVDDTDAAYKKCQSFWEFLQGHPELHHLKVMPEKEFQEDSLKSENSAQSSYSNKTDEDHFLMDDANTHEVSALDWLNREDIMSNAFRSLDQKKYCDQPIDDYCDAREREKKDKLAATKRRNGRLASFKPSPPLKTGVRNSFRTKSLPTAVEHKSSARNNLEDLVLQMKQWDLQHKKSFDPPRLPQLMSEMVMPGSDNIESDAVHPHLTCCGAACIPERPSEVNPLDLP